MTWPILLLSSLSGLCLSGCIAQQNYKNTFRDYTVTFQHDDSCMGDEEFSFDVDGERVTFYRDEPTDISLPIDIHVNEGWQILDVSCARTRPEEPWEFLVNVEADTTLTLHCSQCD